jgi:hypothetical protein
MLQKRYAMRCDADAMRSFLTQKRLSGRRRIRACPEAANTKVAVACTYSTIAEARHTVVYGQRFSGPQSGPV